MFGSQVLEVVIGLTLVYLALSVGCSGLKEVFAGIFSLRARIPTPFSPLNKAWPLNSRTPVSVATSSQKASSETRRPAWVKVARSISICVLLPAPSIPEKLTILAWWFRTFRSLIADSCLAGRLPGARWPARTSIG